MGNLGGHGARDGQGDMFGGGKVVPGEWGRVVEGSPMPRGNRGFHGSLHQVKVAQQTVVVQCSTLHRRAHAPVVPVQRLHLPCHAHLVCGGESAFHAQNEHQQASIGPCDVCTLPPMEAPLMLSVSGARGLVGRSMTPDVAARFAAAFASHLREGCTRPRVILGRDGRASGDSLGRAVSGSLMAAGCDVIDVGIVATPSVAVAIRAHDAQGGMVITASHNPIEWNGLKALDADGLAPPPAIAQSIIDRFKGSRIDWAGPLGAGTHHCDHEADQRHVDRVLSLIDAAPIRAAHFHVVLDSVNGGGSASGRMLLERLGCEVMHINGERLGDFAHTPEPLEANLGQLMRAVAASGAAAVGFAQDPDADRLALIDERGGYLGEECTLAHCTRRMLDRAGSGVVCTNLSTSRMVDDLCAAHPGSHVVRTAVGEANVVAGMRAHGALVGGEGNGGVILPGVCWVRDSLGAMALTLELLASTGKRLSTLTAELPRYSMVKRKMDLSAIGGRRVLEGAFEGVRTAFAAERLTDGDGLRVDFSDGWVHLRASNTEPIVRLIGEAATPERANALCDACASAAGL